MVSHGDQHQHHHCIIGLALGLAEAEAGWLREINAEIFVLLIRAIELYPFLREQRKTLVLVVQLKWNIHFFTNGGCLQEYLRYLLLARNSQHLPIVSIPHLLLLLKPQQSLLYPCSQYDRVLIISYPKYLNKLEDDHYWYEIALFCPTRYRMMYLSSLAFSLSMFSPSSTSQQYFLWKILFTFWENCCFSLNLRYSREAQVWKSYFLYRLSSFLALLSGLLAFRVREAVLLAWFLEGRLFLITFSSCAGVGVGLMMFLTIWKTGICSSSRDMMSLQGTDCLLDGGTAVILDDQPAPALLCCIIIKIKQPDQILLLFRRRDE